MPFYFFYIFQNQCKIALKKSNLQRNAKQLEPLEPSRYFKGFILNRKLEPILNLS